MLIVRLVVCKISGHIVVMSILSIVNMIQVTHGGEDEELQPDNKVWTRITTRVLQQENYKWTVDDLCIQRFEQSF